jgi:hypothetical protein
MDAGARQGKIDIAQVELGLTYLSKNLVAMYRRIFIRTDI